MHHGTSRSCVSHPMSLSGADGSSPQYMMAGCPQRGTWRGGGADGCEHSRAYNAWEVMWSRSSVKIVECEKGEEEREEHDEECEEHEEERKEECKEHERDSHSSHSSPSLQYNRREDREVTAE